MRLTVLAELMLIATLQPPDAQVKSCNQCIWPPKTSASSHQNNSTVSATGGEEMTVCWWFSVEVNGGYLVTSSSPQVRKKHQYRMRGKPGVKTPSDPELLVQGSSGSTLRSGESEVRRPAASAPQSEWCLKISHQTSVSKEVSDSSSRPLSSGIVITRSRDDDITSSAENA